MANYYAKIRTNYFSVTDEAKFREIIASCKASNKIEIFGDIRDGIKKFGFGCTGSIYGFSDGEDGDDADFDMNAFFEALQDVLCEVDAILYTEIGSEKLCYLTANCVVITANEVRSVDLWDDALKMAREMLGNEKFETKCEY